MIPISNSEIEKYLEENLPASEERIPVPMDSACEVCVVIPSYGERDFILNPLESLANQENVTPSLYEVIIVVNNPGHPPKKDPGQSEDVYKEKIKDYRQTLQDNKETMDLIKCLTGEHIDIRLSEKEKEIVKRIKKKGLKAYAVDKSSTGKTLPDNDANVGGARNRGVAEAIERFYTQAKRNGILAHSDADTRFDEYYIRNLIKAFKNNPRLVGLAGADEDTLDDPWNREAMKHFLWGLAKNRYQAVVHRLYFDEPYVFYIQFIGSNMATRAYQTAMIGGISKKGGDEDTHLGIEIAKTGETAEAPDVVNFPIIRYSPRTLTGKGFFMVKSLADDNDLGQIKVRSMETACFLSDICKQLKQARINKKTSVEELRKILILEDRPILDDEELADLSRNIDQLTTCRKEFLIPALHKLIVKILNRVDERRPVIPIREAMSILLDFYFKDRELKNKFDKIKTRMIRERKDALATLEFIFEKIFENGPPEIEQQYLEELLIFLLERNKTPLTDFIFSEKRYRIKQTARLIKISRTKNEAMELIKINYMVFFFLTEDDPVLSVLLDLFAIDEALKMSMP